MIPKIVKRLTSWCVAGSIMLLATSAAQAEVLKVAADVGFAPFFLKNTSGQIEGYSNDLIRAVAKQAGYSDVEVIDTPFSSIFAGLYSKRFDVIAGVVTITPERAKQMLFTEPYLPTGLGFLVKKDVNLASLDGLKGKKIAANSGSSSDTWLQDNASKYGYEIQRFNKVADAVQSTLIGRSFATIADIPMVRYVATQNPAVKVILPQNSGNNFGLVTRKTDVALRDKIEMAMECLKKDGTLTKIHEKWFGPVEADSPVAKIYPGFGAPGFEGYNPAPHTLACK